MMPLWPSSRTSLLKTGKHWWPPSWPAYLNDPHLTRRRLGRVDSSVPLPTPHLTRLHRNPPLMATSTLIISKDNLKIKRREYQHHAALHRLAELELARPTNDWTNIARLGVLCNYPNHQVLPRKLLQKSSILLKDKLSNINLLRRLCKHK